MRLILFISIKGSALLHSRHCYSFRLTNGWMVIVGGTYMDWRRLHHDLLKVIPRDREIDGKGLHLTWLWKKLLTFSTRCSLGARVTLLYGLCIKTHWWIPFCRQLE